MRLLYMRAKAYMFLFLLWFMEKLARFFDIWDEEMETEYYLIRYRLRRGLKLLKDRQ